MNKDQLIETLSACPKLSRHMFIPSRTRAKTIVIKDLLRHFSSETLKTYVHFVVVREEEKMYQESLSELGCDVICIPDHYRIPGMGLDTTRKFIFDYALYKGYDFIYDIDDDIEMLSPLFEASSTSRTLNKAEREKYAEEIFSYGMGLFEWLCNLKDPNLCLGSFCYVSPDSCRKETANIVAKINCSQLARTVNLLNVKRMADRGVERTMGEYDIQCEDVGINLSCLERGCSIARLSSIVFSCPSHKALPRTESTLFGEEYPLMKKVYQHIKSKPIGKYAKPTVKFADGTPSVIGIDWRLYNKEHNSGKVILYEHNN